MSKSPAFRFYASDFFMDTNTWELDEVGLYLRLLMCQWVNGPLPNDNKKLAKIAGISPKKLSNLIQKVSHKFTSDGNGCFYNKRLEEEREKQSKYLEKQKEHGKKGADSRWGSP